MKNFVFVWTNRNGKLDIICGTDVILLAVDGRWSLSTIHRKAREAIRTKRDWYQRQGKTIAGYSVGCFSHRGDNWATCVMGFVPYTGEK